VPAQGRLVAFHQLGAFPFMTCRLLSVSAALALLLAASFACNSRTPGTETKSSSVSTATSSSASSIPEVANAAHPSPPVIFIGLDGADWQLLDEYIAAGAMPNLERIVTEGTAGTLETLHPSLSPLVWTTMMTGVDPVKHRILDFVRFNPASGQKEPITSDERQAPAIWNMATWGGRKIGVFGLWATYPAEPVNGVMVSDRLFTFLFKESTPPEGIVFPREEEAWAREAVQRAEAAGTFTELKQYVPRLTEQEYRAALAVQEAYANPVSALRRTLIETRVYDDLARTWIERARPDLAVVYFQGTDSIGHTFAPFAPPKQPTIEQAEYDRYRGVPRTYFAEIDRLLGRYRELAEQRGGVLMLASDHGFAWSEGRPSQLSSNAQATAAKWHRNQGIYALWGKGIPARGRDAAASGSVRQVCATLLATTGLPPIKGEDAAALPGSPAFNASAADYAAHYHSVAPAMSAGATRTVDADTLARLRALGYIGAAESNTAASRTLQTTRTAGSYNNEGLLLKAQGRKADAIAAFENALIVDPNLASALWNLSDLLFADSTDLDRSDLLLVHAFGAGLPEGTKYLIGRAIGYQRSGQIDRSTKILEAALRSRPEEPEVWLFLGRYRVEKGECPQAVSDFEKATRLAPKNASAYASLGLARLCAGDRDGARRDLQRSLEIDPSQAPVREYLKKVGGD
jgi:predicted AlkP superfamily phosphohydrolase/phosphomutase